MFSQILKLIPRTSFSRLVKETKAEHRSKGLSSWSQFVGMVFCQLGRAHSLREIEGGLKSCEGKLAHLGIEAPARSSLSYANSHRPAELFEKVFYSLHDTVASKAVGKKKFRFKNKLVSIDSTTIDPCLMKLLAIRLSAVKHAPSRWSCRCMTGRSASEPKAR